MKEKLAELLQKSAKSTSLLFKIILIVITLTFIGNIVTTMCSIELLVLNENQLLYLFSMKGQVICGVFALTLTAYIFFADKLRETGENRDYYYEATLGLRKKYFYDLILIAITVAGTVILCVLGISLMHTDLFFYAFIINQSSLLFFIGLFAILIFGVTLLNPKKIDIEVQKLGKEAEKKLDIRAYDKKVLLSEFLIEYNKLEKLIRSISQKLSREYAIKNGYNMSARPKILQSINLLVLFEVFSKEESLEMNEIRKYRNSIVHGIDRTEISEMAYDKIKGLTEKLKDFEEKNQKT